MDMMKTPGIAEKKAFYPAAALAGTTMGAGSSTAPGMARE
jgi:hypothetical protein